LKRDELIPRFVEYGLQGLEAYYPEQNRVTTDFYLKMARQHNIIATGGSDFHGGVKPDVKLGSAKVPYEAVEDLKRLRT
jgi:predicted metal-dependent phosphoesterase TrpH